MYGRQDCTAPQSPPATRSADGGSPAPRLAQEACGLRVAKEPSKTLSPLATESLLHHWHHCLMLVGDAILVGARLIHGVEPSAPP